MVKKRCEGDNRREKSCIGGKGGGRRKKGAKWSEREIKENE